jgi:hypothetical protein
MMKIRAKRTLKADRGHLWANDAVNRIKNRRRRASRLAASLALVATALLTGVAAQASPAAAAGPCPITPFGGIGEYWQQMGGQGFIGCPLDGKEENLGSARVRRFEFGTIAWFPFPDHRPFLLSLKQRPGEPLTVNWWDDYNQGGYLVKAVPVPWVTNGPPKEERGKPSDQGTEFTLPLRKGVVYNVSIEGCPESVVESECYGWLGPVKIVAS